MSSLSPVLSLVAEDLESVDRVIRQHLSTGVPLVGQVAHYIISAGGKRLRPRLLLLMARALSCDDPRRFGLAAVVEFIHTATLLHDDVVDESTLRRGRATANETFGNPASVLVGDFLYSRAFQMMVEAGSMRVMAILAEATNIIAEGEVLQLMNTHDADLDEAAYLRVIQSKTAKLFEASARIAAVLAGAPEGTESACAAYGNALGTAFQIVDDVLDYAGDPEETGKNLGDDLHDGKATLPLIAAMQRADAADADLIRRAIEHGDITHLQRIGQIVRATGALDAAHAVAAAEAGRAIEAARTLPETVYSAGLINLADRLLQRRS